MRLLLLLCILFPLPLLALNVEAPLPQEAQEARAQALFHDIRCVVCQGETVADSPAAVARDFRRLIRTEIVAGKSDEDIKAYLVSRYGDAILMRPPLNTATWLLWFGPALILAIALLLVARFFRRGQA